MYAVMFDEKKKESMWIVVYIPKLWQTLKHIDGDFYQCTPDIPIKPINRPINRYRPINRIGKSDKSQYRIGIGSADYKGLYRLIGFGSKMSLI